MERRWTGQANRDRFSAALALAMTIAISVTGCALQPTHDSHPATDERASSVSADEGLLVARTDRAIEDRRLQLMQREGQVVRPDKSGYYMDVLTARLRQDLAHKQINIEHRGDDIALTFPGTATFDTGSADIRPTMKAVLETLAGILTEYRASLVVVAGHTDSAGPREYNQKLSEQRALSVGRHLLSAGVAADRLVVRGFGPDRPVASNDTPEGRASNRRIELIIQLLVAA
jgi:outer membrane protein OmpA-like peptidoglycan-associated protein